MQIDWNDDEAVCRAVCPDLLISRNGLVFLSITDVAVYSSWGDARLDRRVVAFEAANRPKESIGTGINCAIGKHKQCGKEGCGCDCHRPVQEAAGDDPNDISKDVRNCFVCGAWKKSLEASGVYVMRCDRPEGHAGYHVDKVLLTNWNGPTPKQAQEAARLREEAAGDGFEEWNSRTPIRSGERWLIDYTVQERRTAWTACAERIGKA